MTRETTFMTYCLLSASQIPSGMVSTPRGEQIISFWSRLLFRRDAKLVLRKLLLLKVYSSAPPSPATLPRHPSTHPPTSNTTNTTTNTYLVALWVKIQINIFFATEGLKTVANRSAVKNGRQPQGCEEQSQGCEERAPNEGLWRTAHNGKAVQNGR